MKKCHGRLHYDRKFQIFIFLIGHINVNKGVFCLMISYLQIKSYNVLNYNNCSTDWPFPLSFTPHYLYSTLNLSNYFNILTTRACTPYTLRLKYMHITMMPYNQYFSTVTDSSRPIGIFFHTSTLRFLSVCET